MSSSRAHALAVAGCIDDTHESPSNAPDQGVLRLRRRATYPRARKYGALLPRANTDELFGRGPPATERQSSLGDDSGLWAAIPTPCWDDSAEIAGTLVASGATDQTTGTPRKRQCNRPWRRWTKKESEDLKRGIAICGFGNWKRILEHPQLEFNPCRTPVDLKDHFRVLFPADCPEAWTGDRTTARRQLKPRARSAKGRAPYNLWSQAEDEKLLRGFATHGFKWQNIASDESLHLNRTSRQIADRYRFLHLKMQNGIGRDSSWQPPAIEAISHVSITSQDVENYADLPAADFDPDPVQWDQMAVQPLMGVL